MKTIAYGFVVADLVRNTIRRIPRGARIEIAAVKDNGTLCAIYEDSPLEVHPSYVAIEQRRR